jgi:hypothetical protein
MIDNKEIGKFKLRRKDIALALNNSAYILMDGASLNNGEYNDETAIINIRF